MTKNISLTLYDFFAYLIPGVLALISGCLGTWAIFYSDRVAVLHGYEAWLISAGLGVAYIFGHLIQAGGNLIEKCMSWKIQRPQTPDYIARRIRTLLSTQAHDAGLTDEDIYILCDNANVVGKHTAIREMLEYRRDFYRGTVVALVITIIGLVAGLTGAPLQVEPKADFRFSIPAGLLLVWLGVAIVGLSAAVARYRRFLKNGQREIYDTFTSWQFLNPERKE